MRYQSVIALVCAACRPSVVRKLVANASIGDRDRLGVRSAVDAYIADNDGGCPPTLAAVSEYGSFKEAPRDAWAGNSGWCAHLGEREQATS